MVCSLCSILIFPSLLVMPTGAQQVIASTTAPSADSPTHCADSVLPPPAVDTSEVPLPGETYPPPLPIPSPTPGGEKLATCNVVLPQGVTAPPKDVPAKAWIVSDMDTGKIIGAKDPHGRYRPASIIKVLLAMVVLRELDLNTVVTGTPDDYVEGSAVGIGPGGEYTISQLLHGLLMVSGNDAAQALSNQLGGVTVAVKKMNELAEELGGTSTRVATPSGLDGPGMSTSAFDMALFFSIAMRDPQFATIMGTKNTTFPGYPKDPDNPHDTDHPGFAIGNDNRALTEYDGALGGKTGFTDDALHTYVGAAERHGRRLVVTVLNTQRSPLRAWEQGTALMTWGFAQDSQSTVGLVPVNNIDKKTESQPKSTQASEERHGSRLTFVSLASIFGVAVVAVLASVWTYRRGSRRQRKMT